MTEEMQRSFEREMADAEKIDDVERRNEAVSCVQSHILLALVDCQRKTSDRVNYILAEGDKVKWGIRLVQGFAAGGGFFILAKVLKALGY